MKVFFIDFCVTVDFYATQHFTENNKINISCFLGLFALTLSPSECLSLDHLIIVSPIFAIRKIELISKLHEWICTRFPSVTRKRSSHGNNWFCVRPIN